MLRNLTIVRPLAVLDLETTGTDPKEARIVEISILKLLPHGESEHRTKRVNPGIPIPAEATKVHGITDEDVKDCPSFARIAGGVVDFLEGCDLAGFNLRRYDLRVLLAELRRSGRDLQLSGRKIIDALTIYHARERRDLTAAVKLYLNREHNGAHGAAADVLATVEVLDAQVLRYEDLPRSVDELHDALLDPDAIDLDGNFKLVDGHITFAFGKYKGQRVSTIASDPRRRDYLEWIQGQDFFDDTKQIAREALEAVQ